MSTEFVSMNFMAFHAEFSVKFLMEPKNSPATDTRGMCVHRLLVNVLVCVTFRHRISVMYEVPSEQLPSTTH